MLVYGKQNLGSKDKINIHIPVFSIISKINNKTHVVTLYEVFFRNLAQVQPFKWNTRYTFSHYGNMPRKISYIFDLNVIPKNILMVLLLWLRLYIKLISNSGWKIKWIFEGLKIGLDIVTGLQIREMSQNTWYAPGFRQRDLFWWHRLPLEYPLKLMWVYEQQ